MNPKRISSKTDNSKHEYFWCGNSISDDVKKNILIQKKLLPCRFCGSKKRGFLYFNFFDKVCVRCEDCGYQTIKHKTEYLAMLEWNRVRE